MLEFGFLCRGLRRGGGEDGEKGDAIFALAVERGKGRTQVFCFHVVGGRGKKGGWGGKGIGGEKGAGGRVGIFGVWRSRGSGDGGGKGKNQQQKEKKKREPNAATPSNSISTNPNYKEEKKK